jgi:hypothetical protein
LDTGLRGLKLCLFGGDVPEGGVEPLTVVVSFDIGEQVTLGRLAGRIGGVVNQLGFEGVEPAFHRCQQLPFRLIDGTIPLAFISER